MAIKDKIVMVLYALGFPIFVRNMAENINALTQIALVLPKVKVGA